MTLNEDLLFERGEILRIDRVCIGHFRQVFDTGFDRLEDLDALAALCPAGKREIAKIAGEPNAAGDDDLLMRPLAVEPFAGAEKDIVNGHGFQRSVWRVRMRSRNSAA